MNNEPPAPTGMRTPMQKTANSTYPTLITGIGALLEESRRAVARTVNCLMTATYWEIGRRIVEFEQGGKKRAEFGDELLARLSADLTAAHGRGFSRPNLQRFRDFYLAFPVEQIRSTLLSKSSPEIRSTASSKLTAPEIVRTPPGKYATALRRSDEVPDWPGLLEAISQRFPLPWSHYVRLLTVKDEAGRRFYEEEALRGGWSVRQLDRQISTLFYERTALSRNKVAVLKKGAKAKAGEALTVDEAIRDPLVLEFLNLKDEYSETELEAALIRHLEAFLLELGSDFTFVGRQRRLRVGGEWYRVDLIFFHRRLRCLVVVDLKLGKLTHADAGQMHLYLNYAREHWTHAEENPPVGLILCSSADASLVHYTLDTLPNKVMAREYKLALPAVKKIEEEIRKARRLLESPIRRQQ